ncbi:hypothetical protein NON08_10765 [Cetobacterium somerae]|uniref:hypothetical protein n=1 Tax=Cetobacterium sp. NK01 TaxID=2993530 RepID=UPI002115E18D|nr:hypothetical protein [Cetobacterium sp. NK01]MCQ8213003.1 hypothetical protein [Cetobacterium sp. NK01]
MNDVKTNKQPLIIEDKIINVPPMFVELFALNPRNLKKWLVGAKNSNKSYEDLKVKDILNTKVNAAVNDEAFLLDVTFGNKTHKLYLKKPEVNKGLDFILTEGDKFKIETNLHLNEINENKCNIHLETILLESKHSFHPIVSFELKYFFKKSLSNFIEECEKSYSTLQSEEKTVEAEVLNFYQNNLKSFNELIEPIKADLGEESFQDIQRKIKTLGMDTSDKATKLFTNLIAIVPAEDLSLVNDKVIQFIKEHIFVLKGISKKSNAENLKDINTITKLQLDNINFIVPQILKDIDSDKIVEVENQLNDLLATVIKEIEAIIEEIKNKVPPQHFKDLEVGFVNTLKNDLDSAQSLLKKINLGNTSFSEKETKILNNLKESITKIETTVNNRDNQAYISVLNMVEKSLKQLEQDMKNLSSNITAEKIESTKSLIKSTTDSSYKSLTTFLSNMTPENLENNKEIVNQKIEEILDRYVKAIKIISPAISDDKLTNMREKVKIILSKEYESFCASKK